MGPSKPPPLQTALFLVGLNQLIQRQKKEKLKKNWINRSQKNPKTAQEPLQKDLMIALRNPPRNQEIPFSGVLDLLIQQSGNVKLRKSCAKLISTTKNLKLQITHSTKMSPITYDREIDQRQKKKRKKFVVRLLQKKL